MMAERIEVDGYGAFMTDDPSADGYYVVQWAMPPYMLQENCKLEEYTAPIIIEKDELVCEARYWSKVPRARLW
jgi:hypothetical protein